MATTDLKLQEAGALVKPGPIGRIVRLGFGAATLSYAFMLWGARADLMIEGQQIRPLILNGVLPGLFLISYIVNIGFSRAWKKWPALVSILLIGAAAIVGYVQTGAFQSPLLARTIHAWELYLYGHLGLAFVLAGLMGAPGCEMRALHHLFSFVTGRPAHEHHCPVGPLNAIDHWEAKQPWSRQDR